jgi:hypothetical protein
MPASNSAFRRRLLAVAVLVPLGLLGGCGGRPMEYPTPASEMGREPGLFSGDDGEFVLYRQRQEPPPPR